MIPYYITFLVSVIFCWLGESNIRLDDKQKEHKKISKLTNRVDTVCHLNNKGLCINRIHFKLPKIKRYHLYLVLSVTAVVLLAGMRDYTVGTDVQVYGNSLFYYAKEYHPFSVYLDRFSHIEPLYLALVYFSAMVAQEPHILYFLTGLLIYAFLMLSFVKIRGSFPITLTWLAFLCLLYGDTYNAMRQCVAIAIGIWAFFSAVEGYKIKFIVGVLVAFLFHNTAIIIIPTYFVYFILQKNNKFWVKCTLLILVFGGIVFFNEILSYLMQIGLLDDKMEKYYISESTGLSVFAILIRLPFFVLIILNKKAFLKGNMSSCKMLRNENEADFYIMALMFEMLSVEMSAFVPSLYRISLYFIPFRCMAYARICKVLNKKNRMVLLCCLILYLLVVFIYQNQIKGNNEIYPYIFGY